jgi:hypothetical protein
MNGGGLSQLAAMPDWLHAATDPQRVSRALAHAVPELASGALTISVRMKRDVWVGAYTVTLTETAGRLQRTVALRATILPPGRPAPPIVDQAAGANQAVGTGGWRGYLPDLRIALEMQPPDARLPSLPILTDAEQARELLERCVRAAAPAYADLRIESCAPRIMRYTPGSRCTVLYRLTYSPQTKRPDWPDVVVAKTYKGEKGRHAYAGMQVLWEAPFRRTSGVAIAEPLAFVPDLNVLVQGPVREEQTLQEKMASAARTNTPAALDELYRFVRQTAAGLAELHRSDVGFGATRTFEDELAEVRGVVDDLASAVPDIAEAAAPLLAWLESRADAHPADPIGTVHGTFRPGQVLIHQGEIGFIDFDGFGQAEPALDLSLFFRRTKDIVLDVLDGDPPDDQTARAGLLALADTICEAFLREYETHFTVSRQRIALWEALDLLTMVLHSWTKAKPRRLKNAIFALEQHLRKLEGGA